MQKAYSEVQDLADKEKITLRMAANWTAVKRVAEATRTRGIYP